MLIRWSLQKGYVQRPFRSLYVSHKLVARFIPLPKSTQPDRVVSNANVFGFELSDGDMCKLDALDKGAAGAISWNPVNAP